MAERKRKAQQSKPKGKRKDRGEPPVSRVARVRSTGRGGRGR